MMMPFFEVRCGTTGKAVIQAWVCSVGGAYGICSRDVSVAMGYAVVGHRRESALGPPGKLSTN